jgi:hypothetical protein
MSYVDYAWRALREVFRSFRTAPFLAMFLLAVAIFIVAHYHAVVTDWRAMYPPEPNRQTALQLCYIENHQFIRSDAKARDTCYERWLPILAFKAGVETVQGFSGHLHH